MKLETISHHMCCASDVQSFKVTWHGRDSSKGCFFFTAMERMQYSGGAASDSVTLDWSRVQLVNIDRSAYLYVNITV